MTNFDGSPRKISQQFDYRPDIDGLRAIAILAVIVFHLNENWLPGGFVGVDIFFVISGYVITNSILKKSNNSYFYYFSLFYIRRIRRLLPNLVVCIFITLILTALFVPAKTTESFYESGVSALIGISNFFFITNSSDYFGITQKLNPFTHTWSLGLEEQFYLFFPFILLLGYGLNLKILINRKDRIILALKIILSSFLITLIFGFVLNDFFETYIPSKLFKIILFTPILLGIAVVIAIFFPGKNNYSRAFCLVFFSCVCSFIILVYLTLNKQSIIAYYFMPARFWELAAGASLFLGISIFECKKKFEPIINSSMLSLFSIVLIIVVLVCTTTLNFPFPWAIISVIGAMLIIVSGCSKENLLYKSLARPTIVGIGKMSYSLYLWHWPIIIIFKWTIGLTSVWEYILCILLIFFTSMLAYKFIEKPFRFSGNKAIAPLLLLGTLSFVFLLKTNAVEKVYKDSYLFDDINSLLPEDHLSSMKCHATGYEHVTGEINLESCFIPKKKDTRTIYLIGDSHAAAHLPMLRILEQDFDIEVLQFTGGPIFLRSAQLFPKLLLHFKAHLKANDLIIAVSHRIYVYKNHASNQEFSALVRGEDVDLKLASSNIILGARKNLNLLADIADSKGASIVLVGDTPQLGSEALSACLLQYKLRGKSICDVPREISEKHAEPLNNLYRQLSKKQNVIFWNPHNLICKSKTCMLVENGMVAYVNSSHLSKNGSESLYPYFKEFLIEVHLLNRTELNKWND